MLVLGARRERTRPLMHADPFWGGMAMDRWDQAEAYEQYVGRWSRRLAPRFLTWAQVPPRSRVLDVGCGTGAVTEAALAVGAAEVVGLDASASYVETARGRLAGRPVRFEVGDATKLPFPDASFDAVVSGLVLNFLPDPVGALWDMRRVTRSGGAVAAYVWDYARGMEPIRHFWDAVIELDAAGAAELDEGKRFSICREEALRDLFKEAGLQEVSVTRLDEPATYRDFDDYWTPFLSGQGPAPGYAAGLTRAKRDELRDALRARVPVDSDGRIRLMARAWAVCGVP